MGLVGSTHAIEVSTTNQDSSTAETRNYKMRLQEGHNTAAAQVEFYRQTQETGLTTHLEESAPTPIAKEWRKSIRVAGDDVTVPFFLYWPTQGNAATSHSTLNGSVVGEDVWSGPNSAPTARSFSMEDLGKPGTSDADFNRLVHNVTPERVVISGQRRGVITVSADLLGGKTVTAAGGTGNTFVRNRLYNFGMCYVKTNATGGFASTTTYFGGATAPTSAANTTTLSQLAATITDITSLCQEWSITATQNIDMTRSMAPGNLDTDYAAIIPASTDYVYGNDLQQLEFEMLFNQDSAADSGNIVEGLRGEYEAGTLRGFEIWLVHPNYVESGANDSYYGMKVTCANMSPQSWAEENDAFGQRYVRVRYKAVYSTSKSYAWHIACGTPFSQIGG